MIRYDRRKLEFGIWNLIKGSDFSVNRHVIVSNDHSLQFTKAVLRYFVSKRAGRRMSSEQGTWDAPYRMLSSSRGKLC
ncbi:hypothetical protein I309_03500 [Cryptococcus deuterogattii LA55]|nr:hypothetical protein I309_03500 [Cryptococcus deuterogattii LA55]KIR33337.1 hypothetical protein I352_04104 [Cryptococcus deuterogattii MMRL2647]KIR73256.1 hypothetical protein I310_02920 [Cryptococcus deuterogattii CA1014]KIR91591.1 hypothetical protein I304_04413 [Cryptococcus deuterogattii CBS 10090]KIR99012.1 hypothetical protein L804_03632 [Cryptococcus deuterogattii 2001/935-1]